MRTAIAIVALGLGGCSHYDSGRNAERARKTEGDTAARKAGRAAYDIAQEAEKAAKKAGQKLKETSHDVHEGWKDAQREKKEK